MLALLVNAGVVPSSLFISNRMEAILSSETSVLTRASVTSQKTEFFIVTAVITSNLT
jgi:hypothetical protein